MSKRDNTLLSESQIRKFMKLAELTPLADGFVEGLSEEKDPDWGGGKGEYKRSEKDGVKKKTGDVKGHYKDYEGPEGGNKGDKSKSDPGDEDYTWRKGKKSKTHSGPDLEESHGRSPKEGAQGRDKPDQNSRLEEAEADPEALEDYALGDEERGEPDEAFEDELEAAEEEEPVEDDLGPDRSVSVDDFLAALETALEDVLGDEVEVEQEEEVELAPEEEEVELADVEVEDELELQEMVNLITKRVAKRIVKEALKKS